MTVDDFVRVLKGETPLGALTPKAVEGPNLTESKPVTNGCREPSAISNKRFLINKGKHFLRIGF